MIYSNSLRLQHDCGATSDSPITKRKDSIKMTDENQNEINFNPDMKNLYREESFTDLKVASVRRFVPVNPDGSDDKSRTSVFIGSTQLMTPEGPLPIQSGLQANNLKEAFEAYPAAMEKSMQQVIEQIKSMKEKEEGEKDSRIIVPGR